MRAGRRVGRGREGARRRIACAGGRKAGAGARAGPEPAPQGNPRKVMGPASLPAPLSLEAHPVRRPMPLVGRSGTRRPPCGIDRLPLGYPVSGIAAGASPQRRSRSPSGSLDFRCRSPSEDVEPAGPCVGRSARPEGRARFRPLALSIASMKIPLAVPLHLCFGRRRNGAFRFRKVHFRRRTSFMTRLAESRQAKSSPRALWIAGISWISSGRITLDSPLPLEGTRGAVERSRREAAPGRARWRGPRPSPLSEREIPPHVETG